MATDIEAINAETASIHYTAHEFLGEGRPKMLFLDTDRSLSVNKKHIIEYTTIQMADLSNGRNITLIQMTYSYPLWT